MKNLNILDAISQNLNSRLEKEQIEIAERQKRIQRRQQEQNLLLETKFNDLTNQKQSMKLELDSKESKLSLITDNKNTEIKNLLNLKIQQSSLIQKLQQDNDKFLKEKDQSLKKLNIEIQDIKADIKNLRAQIRTIENEDDSYEDRKFDVQIDRDKQAEKSKHIMEQLAKEDQLSQELQSQISGLKHRQEGLVRESKKAPQNQDEVDIKLERVKIDNTKQQEQNKNYQQTLGQMQAENSNNLSKNEELNNFNEILKLQAKFEKIHTEINMKLSELNNMQSKQDSLLQLNIKNLKQIQQQISIHNADLSNQLYEQNEKLKNQILQANDLKDDIKILTSKVCNKNQYELKIETLQSNFSKLLLYQESLQQKFDEEESFDTDCQDLQRKLNNWIQKQKTDLHYENQNLSDQNENTMKKISKNTKEFQDKTIHLDKKYNRRISLVKDTDLGLLKQINDQLLEQQVRLKNIQEQNLVKLGDDFKQILKNIEDLNNKLMLDQSLQKRQNLNNLDNQLEQIDRIISDYDERIKCLQREIDKMDPKSDEFSKIELVRNLQSLMKGLEDCKNIKDKLKYQIKRANTLSDEDLVQFNIEELTDQINLLSDKQLPKIDTNIYELEKQLKRQQNQKRNQKQKQFYQNIEDANSQLNQLSLILEKIDQEIKRIDKDTNIFLQCYNYQDIERTEEAETKIYTQLQSHQEALQFLKKKRDELSKQLIEIETNPNSSQNQKISFQGNEEIKQNSDDAILTQWNKDLKYKECLQNQGLKQSSIEDMNRDIQLILRNLEHSNEYMKEILVPEDDNSFDISYKDKVRKYQQNSSRVSQIQDKSLSMQFRLDEICKDLTKLSQKKVLTRDLQQIIDDLNRLELDLEYQMEDVKVIEGEAKDLLNQTNSLLDQNRKSKIDQAEKALKNLQASILFIDDKYREVQLKLDEYQQKIKEGVRENISDENIINELKKLKKESEEIEQELQLCDQKRAQLITQEKVLKDKLSQMKQQKSSFKIKDFGDLTNLIGEQNNEANEFLEDLNIKCDDLDQRILYLEQFLQKHSLIQNLFSEFDQLLGNVNKNLLQETKKFDEISDLQDLLRNVLLEMEKGTNNDYKLKEGFIRTELDKLQEIEDIIFNMDEVRQSISVNLQILNQDKSKHMESQQRGQHLNIDPEQLQQMISESMELLDKLSDQERQAMICLKRLAQIKKDIGIADVPELIQLREKEIQEFSGKIRKLEQEYNEIKKQMMGGSPKKELSQELNEIDNQLKIFREEKQNVLRIFGADLQIFLPMPQKLENLKTLKDTIKKVRELGEHLNKNLESIDLYQVNAVKLKRKIGGMDIAKRLKDLENREEDQRSRLEKLRKRFETIGKGAADCDGYTSNTEEATFIDTLLAELPEMLNKQKGSIEDCDYIQGQIYEIKREITKVEDNVDLNEKSVVFLEKLADKLEDHFLSMDVKKKLDKRQLELQELQNICEDFAEKLLDMQEHLINDIEKIDQKRRIQNPLQDLLVDENGNPVNLLEELILVSDELKEILGNVSDLQGRNEEIRRRRKETQYEFEDQILRNSPYKGTGSPSKISNKQDVFTLLKANGWMKKKIIDMIKQLKEVSKRMRENKSRYQDVRNKLERQAPRKLYKAVKGDMVDELFADYINRLNCPVPIKRLGNNQYTFGTKKIFAKIINGKLVIRVGGGYMGIEEFMMYYGQQELQKLQKEEMAKLVTEGEVDINDGLNIGGGLLDDEFLTDEDEGNNFGRKSKGAGDIDIDDLKKKLKDDSTRKKRNLNRSFGSDHEENKGDAKNTIVGIGDVRKALKKNVFSIQTYEEGKSGQKPKKGQQVNISSNQVEKELKQIEKRVGTKLKSNLESRMSPRREKTNSQYSDTQSQASSKTMQRQHMLSPNPQTTTRNERIEIEKILQLVSHLWGNAERILFYFDNDQMIIYPEEKGGFDRVYARIHILNTHQKSGDGQHFFTNYSIKSQKDKNAILIQVTNLPTFIDNLKILVDLGYDAILKLTQMQQEKEIKKYIDITGISASTKEMVRSFIEITCHFDLNLFPEQISQKQVNFIIDAQACQSVLQKFTSRLNIISDEYGKICFKATKDEGNMNTQLESDVSQQQYQMELYSLHMRQTVQNRGFPAVFTEISEMKGKYKVCLKKEIFQKFFSILKISGSAVLKINHKEILEMEYTLDKCPYIQVIFETPSRSI
eukprot:403347449